VAACIDSSDGIRDALSAVSPEQICRRSDGQPLTLLGVLTVEI
jgi:hypothetical protein